MRKTLFSVCLGAFLAPAALSAQTMIPFEQGGKWGYKNAQGEVIVEAKYAEASSAVDGYGLVARESDDDVLMWGVVTSDGAEALPLDYVYVDLCNEGIVAVYRGPVDDDSLYFDDGLWWFVDLADPGRDMGPRYSVVGPFVDGVAWVGSSFSKPVKRQMRVMPIMDKKGKPTGEENIIFGVSQSFMLEDMFIPDDSGKVVIPDGEWMLVDRDGKAVTDPDRAYEAVGMFEDGLAWVKRGGLFGFINQQGEEVIPVIYPMVQDAPGSHPAALLMRPENGAVRWVMNGDGKTAWLNEKGEVVIDFTDSDGRVSVFDKVDESMWDY